MLNPASSHFERKGAPFDWLDSGWTMPSAVSRYMVSYVSVAKLAHAKSSLWSVPVDAVDRAFVQIQAFLIAC